MKPWLSLALVSALATTSAVTAHAETWKCLYKGTWVTTKTKNSDTMDWLLQWEKAGAGWKVMGDYNDRYGHAWFDGTCANKTCVFTQDYKSGKLAGKKYYFTGDYSDRWIDDATTESTFKGTWGYQADNRSNGGVWDSVATCKRETGAAAGAPAVPPSPPPTKNATKNDTVEAMLTGASWGAWSVEMGSDTYYAIGGCRPGGTDATCEARVFTKAGKLVKALSATVPDADPPNLTELNKMKVDLDQVLGHNVGSALTAHSLAAGPVKLDTISMKWDARTRQLSVFNKGKLFKKVQGAALPKGMRLDGATVYMFDAGSPPAAVLQLEFTEIEGISSEHPMIVFPLPELDGGD